MKGFFIALEGIDGCGKTTQLKALADWLPTSGLMPDGAQLIATREPGGTAFGASLRNMLLAPEAGKEPCSRAELLLYMADRAQHVETVIYPALDAGHWVLCDRYSASTYAYQCFGRDFRSPMIRKMQNFASQEIEPDLQILLDISVEEALRRTKDKRQDRIESEGEAFLRRVRDGYHTNVSHVGQFEFKFFSLGQMIAIDGSKSVEEVTQKCKDVISFCVKKSTYFLTPSWKRNVKAPES